METPKVICPVCGGEVMSDNCLFADVYVDESVEGYIGTCEKCGETVEYVIKYPHLAPKIETVDHYKD